jgi:DNA polymerase III delta prime subunit
MTVPTRPTKRAPAPPQRPAPTTKPPAAKALPSHSASRNPFEDMIEDRPAHGRFLMLYGPPGMGKTTLAAKFPKCAFITTSGEQGIYLYKEKGLVSKDMPIVQLDPLFPHDQIPAGTGHPGYQRCLLALERFRDKDHDFKTMVIDSVSGLQDLCYQHCASTLYSGDMDSKEFTAYFAGYTKAAEAFWSSEILKTILEIVAKGLNVVLLAHSTFKPVQNANGPDYDQYRPELDKGFLKYVSKDLHGMFFMGQEIMVSIDQKTKKKTTMGDRRFIGMAPTTYYLAKSWCTPEGVTEIDCGDSADATYKKLAEVLGM